MNKSRREPTDYWRYAWWAMVLVVAILFATAALPLLPTDQWWIRIGDYPRLQLLVTYLLCLPWLILFRRQSGVTVAVLALVLSAAIQLYWIYPYLPVATRQVTAAESQAAEKQVRLLTANVLQSNDDAIPLLELVEQQNPDILVLCEINSRWAEQVASLKERFNFHTVHPQENGYGIAFYSQLEVPRCDIRHMVEEKIPSIDAEVVLRDGTVVRVFAVHPSPPSMGDDTTDRDAELVLVGREVQDEPSVIVLGDLNDVGWSRTSNLFREVSRLLDPRKGRGFYNTFDAQSWIKRYPLDYVFHSDDFRVAHMEVLPSIGSDHFPLFIQLSHEPPAEATQSAPELDAGDRQDAEDAVEAVQSKADTDKT